MHFSAVFTSFALVLAGISTALPIKRENMLIARFSDSNLLSEVKARAYDREVELYRRYRGTVSVNNYISHELTRRQLEIEGPNYRGGPSRNEQGQGLDESQLRSNKVDELLEDQKAAKTLITMRKDSGKKFKPFRIRKSRAKPKPTTADEHQSPDHPLPGPSIPKSSPDEFAAGALLDLSKQRGTRVAKPASNQRGTRVAKPTTADVHRSPNRGPSAPNSALDTANTLLDLSNQGGTRVAKSTTVDAPNQPSPGPSAPDPGPSSHGGASSRG